MSRRATDEGLEYALDLFQSKTTSFTRAHEAAILADMDGKIIRVNPQARLMFGYDDMEGMCLEELMPEDGNNYRERHKAGLARVRSGETSQVVDEPLAFHGLHSSGKPFKICLRVMHIHKGRGYFCGVIEKRSWLSPRVKEALTKAALGVLAVLSIWVPLNRYEINQNREVLVSIYENALVAAQAAKNIQALKREDLPEGTIKNLTAVINRLELIKMSIQKNQGIADEDAGH